ncbi:(2Fe-2S)-binding protein [Sulfurovum mangrovi]|uniref:(2Fe-2S)-binding protein n=1 Tax=Sulfurovum mangrovi TaxID=2893889 RepID=UPI001E546B6D|nr:(2Fe-2S)-binding protein [Sulfurovum mangrovi]UFH60306.1 (2Fe-2S)-binding protein [Sulfurovum mangrovi]
MTREEIAKLGDDYEVCQCMAITLGEIIEAIKGGATTVEALMESTEAGTVCELCQSREMDEDEDRELHLDEIIAAYTPGD